MTNTPRTILVIFCLLLLAPSMGQWFKLDPFSRHNENRKLAERPHFAWTFAALKKFPLEYQAYFNDNFGFRNTLVRGNYIFRYALLGSSPSSQVVIGREDWLYYTGEGELNDYRGITSFNDEQLRRCTQLFILKRDWLKQQGIRYLLVIAPNKSSIHPEFLPAGYVRVRNGTGLDDFMEYVHRQTDLDVVDLRGSLLAAKGDRPLYLRTDTHWNGYGAFLGYRELVRPLANWYPSVTPFELDDFTITLKKCSAGDLAGMIGGVEFLADNNYEFLPKRPFTAIMSDVNKEPQDPFTMTKNMKGLPRALIFRDSFFTALVPFVAEHFSVSRFIWDRWNSQTPMVELIDRYKPDLVIEEVVERGFKRICP